MRRFLHQWGGLSLTGDITEQKLAFFHGKGRNGKSTLVDQWGHVAGDYGGSVAIETFLEQGRGARAAMPRRISPGCPACASCARQSPRRAQSWPRR
jgi:phage/plasmid-associated DNA primase